MWSFIFDLWWVENKIWFTERRITVNHLKMLMKSSYSGQLSLFGMKSKTVFTVAHISLIRILNLLSSLKVWV